MHLADQQLAQPIPAPKLKRVPVERDAIELARERSLERRPAHEPLQRARGLHREHCLGIEL